MKHFEAILGGLYSSFVYSSVAEFENTIVTHRTLQEFINSKDTNDMYKNAKNASKDSYLTVTFKSELSELSFKSVSIYLT